MSSHDLSLWFQGFADVLDGELLLRVDLSGCSLSEGSFSFAQRQTETQTGAQLRAGESFIGLKIYYYFIKSTLLPIMKLII